MENNQSIGAKILALRKEKGLTQADLGQYLNISYQAVSKWERDESCPDFDTLSRLAQFFGVPISYFEKGGEEIATTYAGAEEQEEGKPEKTMLGICKECGKVVNSGEEWISEPYVVCKRCHDRKVKQQQEEEKRKKQEAERKALERQIKIIEGRNKGLIWGAVVGGIVLIIGVIAAFSSSSMGIPLTLLGAIVAGALAFTFTSQMFWEGAVEECCSWGGKVIGTPGLIFTFDLDGVIWLIGMKILFAVLRFIVYMVTLIFFAALAILISPFTFVSALRRVNSGDLVD